MSDLTAMSQEYAESASFSERVNEEVLIVKKAILHGWKASTELSDARSRLARRLEVIAQALARSKEPCKVAEPVSQEMLERLEESHRTDLDYFVEDLRSAARALLADVPPSPETVATCDELCSAADATASASFRRLRRR